MKAPYTSAVKYIYQALPFFSLAAASLATKSVMLLRTEKTAKFKKALFLSLSVFGLVLLVTPIVANMSTALELAQSSYLIFRVQHGLDVG